MLPVEILEHSFTEECYIINKSMICLMNQPTFPSRLGLVALHVSQPLHQSYIVCLGRL